MVVAMEGLAAGQHLLRSGFHGSQLRRESMLCLKGAGRQKRGSAAAAMGQDVETTKHIQSMPAVQALYNACQETFTRGVAVSPQRLQHVEALLGDVINGALLSSLLRSVVDSI